MLYKYIDEDTVQEEQNPLITTITIEEIVEEEPVQREVEVTIVNPTQDDYTKAGYKMLIIGRVVEEIPEGQYAKVTYENGEVVIVKDEDLADKEVIDEPKPTEELDEYHYWGEYQYETETQIINSWKVTDKEIQGDIPTYDEQIQYLTWTDDTSGETVVLRTYTVNDKIVVEDDEPQAPDDYEEHTNWYEKENYTHYEATEIHTGYVWKETERKFLDNLECTKREFCLCIKELKGVTYNQIRAIINASEDFSLEWNECIQLLRGNPALDIAGEVLQVTSTELDAIFKYANGIIGIEELRNA